MNGQFESELNDNNSRVYRSRAQSPKHARLRWEPAEYVLSWGTQRFSGPHVVVSDPAGAYGVAIAIFFATHRPVPELPDHYLKVVRVRALRVERAVTLHTRVDGKKEMTAYVPAGAYIVQNPSGEKYAMSAEEFEWRYEVDE